MPRVVLDMMDRRPIWAMPEWVRAELRAALPEGWELAALDVATDGMGDGASRVAPAVLEAVSDADAYFGYGIPGALLEAGPGLRWVHSGSAGVGKSLTPQMLSRPVIFTNSAGVHAAPMAETVIAMVLYFMRGLDFAVEGQRRGKWSQERYYTADAPVRELSEATVGIVGYGGIGKEVARRAAGLGARVMGLRRRATTHPSEDLRALGSGASLGDRVEVVYGPEGLDRLLGESDVVVLSAPGTTETRGLIDAAALARMKAGSLIVSVGRGNVVDEDALVHELGKGRLRGAGLDVFSEEPLPEGHPLWELPNVLLTPHVSAVTRSFWRRETDLILRNLRKFLDGAPVEEWENVVDKRAGY